MLTETQRFKLAAVLRSMVLRTGPLYQRTRSVENAARWLVRRPHENDFSFFGQLADESRLFLDVGANSGISAVSFRIFNRSASILSIEPNPIHESDLRFTGRLVRPFHYALVGVGARAGTSTLYVPTYRGVQVTPLATFERRVIEADWRLKLLFGERFDPGALEIREVPVPVRAVDDFNLNPGAVKIDVEGHEPATLDGMAQTLDRARPVLLMEWSRDWVDCQARLDQHGYVTCVLQRGQLIRYDGENKGLNMWCLPAEHHLVPSGL